MQISVFISLFLSIFIIQNIQNILKYYELEYFVKLRTSKIVENVEYHFWHPHDVLGCLNNRLDPSYIP